ncbi:MAG: cell envelope integrity protein CreD [Bacteroidota bacterium]
MENETRIPTFIERNSAIIKGVFIGFLILILLIPTGMVQFLITERQERETEAIEEVSSKWGNSQSFIGPILKVPYFQINKLEKLNAAGEKEVELNKKIEYAYFLPDKLEISGKIDPEKRSRGIYDITVYRSQMNFKGNFAEIPFQKMNVSSENIIWKDAEVIITLSDFRGLEEEVILDWNGSKSNFNSGEELVFGTGEQENNNISGIYTPVVIENEGKSSNNFSFSINVKGSESLNFIPVGKTTEVHLESNWANPSFNGSFLPDKREVTAKGFTASWKVLHLNRDFSQYWTNTAPATIKSSSFGVKLISPNDNYQKSSRSAKYAILIISLTFLAFFFTEIVNSKKVHPFNYILIGIALCIFYTLLISISEFFTFNIAYVIATLMTIGLIFWYSKSIFGNKRPATIIALVMLALYGFIFVIIQLEDTALLIGSIGLFIILAITMYISRKIDWANLGVKQS